MRVDGQRPKDLCRPGPKGNIKTDEYSLLVKPSEKHVFGDTIAFVISEVPGQRQTQQGLIIWTNAYHYWSWPLQ